ncbi:MAG: hypothetical protein GC161_19485 [Planctomycetaceae bacterium]|nr:hypothetical protein [Planctomycetaceae bacterium]
MKLLTPLLVAAAAFFAPAQEPKAPVLNLSTHDVADILELAVDDLQAEDPEAAAKQRADRLVDLLADIHTHMEPPMGTANETVRAVGNGNLVALLDTAQEGWLGRFLEAQRSAAATFFEVHTRIAWLPLETAAEMGISSAPRVLDPTEFLALRVQLDVLLGERSAPANSVTAAPYSAPRILTSNGQRANVSVLEEQHFVTGYRTYERVQPGGGSLVVPEITTQSQGEMIDVRCVNLAGGAIGVDFRLQSHRHVLPVVVEETPDGPVARPRKATCTAEANLVLPGPAAVLIGGLERDGHVHFAVVHVRPVTPR